MASIIVVEPFSAEVLTQYQALLEPLEIGSSPDFSKTEASLV